jgi:hypothetical protein
MLSTLIEAPTLKALLLFAAKNDARQYLNAFYFETTSTGTYAVATNGHCLAVARIDETQGRNKSSVLVHRDNVEAILKINSKHGIAIEQLDNDQVKLTGINGAITAKIAEGTYPDWRRVTNSQQTGEIAYFNPEYLAMVNKAGQIINKQKDPYVVQQNGGSVGYCNINDVVHAYVMPMRGYGEVVSAPAWY